MAREEGFNIPRRPTYLSRIAAANQRDMTGAGTNDKIEADERLVPAGARTGYFDPALKVCNRECGCVMTMQDRQTPTTCVKVPPSESSAVGTSSQERVLAVLNEIIREGAVGLSVLSTSLCFPRSSVHRALASLISFGWVRKRLGDGAYTLSANYLALTGKQYIVASAIEAVAPLLGDINAKEGIHADLALYSSDGALSVVESTSKQGYVDQKIPRNELFSFAASISLNEEEQEEFQRFWTCQDLPRPGDLWKGVNFHNTEPVFYSNYTAMLPVRVNSVSKGAIRLRASDKISNSRQQVLRILDHLKQKSVYPYSPTVDLFFVGMHS